MKAGLRLCCIALMFGLVSANAQSDTNTFDPRKALRFWAAIQGTNAVRVGAFGDSVSDAWRGGKTAGFLPHLRELLENQSGGVTSDAPYLYYTTNGIGAYVGPDTDWWWQHHHLTNGSAVTFLSSIANGPSNNVTYVWCDTVAAYYITAPNQGVLTISVSTNGGPFGVICAIDTAGPRMGAATNISLPLNYYQMRISCTNGTATVIDGGMWIEHQRNLVWAGSTAPGMAYADWTSLPTNITWPIFNAWKPNLFLMEAKDSADSFRDSFPLLEQMFTNCAPGMDAIYIGTTAQATNGDPNINQEYAIPQNKVMADLAQQFSRAYWDSFGIISYEQATALGWTIGDGTHFNLSGATAMGNMLWSDMWLSLHQIQIEVTQGDVAISWFALLDRAFQLQFASTVSPPDWQNLGPPLTATNLFMKARDSLSGAQPRFYRLLLLP